MVFANLQSHEKDAFFSLLDEYFASRPDIFSSATPGNADGATRAAATSAVHRAFANNPEATGRLISAGLTHGAPKSGPYSATASNPEVNNAVGRVAAASLAFSANKSSPSRSPPPVAEKPGAAGLKPIRKMGDVDTTSVKNMFGSLRNSKTPHTPPIVPAALAPPKNTFGPPPMRRVASGSGTPEPPAPPPRRQPSPEPEPEEEEAQGEWAEVLYDYESSVCAAGPR
ncbi:hypothetical protein BD779DRAFT_1540001 [Infundibulicybe gibba]|nr:hypothetical protein BD779DRAFT_1540001 [Infundibulicybe gibba]